MNEKAHTTTSLLLSLRSPVCIINSLCFQSRRKKKKIKIYTQKYTRKILDVKKTVKKEDFLYQKKFSTKKYVIVKLQKREIRNRSWNWLKSFPFCLTDRENWQIHIIVHCKSILYEIVFFVVCGSIISVYYLYCWTHKSFDDCKNVSWIKFGRAENVIKVFFQKRK